MTTTPPTTDEADPVSVSRADRVSALQEAMKTRVLVLDGAMGTLLQDAELGPDDFGGETYEGCNEQLVFTRPELIQRIHADYLRAGADITETNTFGATPLVLAEYGLQDTAYEQNRIAAQLARAAAAEVEAEDGRPRWVAGSMGPTTRAISVTGGVTFDALIDGFELQAAGLLAGGADYLLIETAQDTRNVKAALLGIERAFEKAGARIPVAVSGTIEPMGTMLAGQSVEALAASLEHTDLLYLGLNCATGPEFMTDHLRGLAEHARWPVSCVPNAGLPDENGRYLETPEGLARVVRGFVERGWVGVVGGCCGTHQGHVRALAEAVKALRPAERKVPRRSTLSGIDLLEVTDELRPVIVGERTNVIGSRRFKELIIDGAFEDAAEIARAQVKKGAQIIDVCLANPDRDELADMERFLEALNGKVRVPLMIDSTDPAVIELALTHSQGKAIINSVNLEDGEERFEQVAPLARRYGAALVVGCIDEEGMAVDRTRKVAVAVRSHQLLTQKYGIPEEDLYFDPLVFPCASGDVQYEGSAVETIEGVRGIKEALPRCKTVLGISNVSFGLPTAGREVLNSVFLHHAVEAGLDLALVNSEKLVRSTALPDEERKLSEDLLFSRVEDPITPFAAHFREKKPEVAVKPDLPRGERLTRYVIEGAREGLLEDLEAELAETAPLDIINGPLMEGMDEVGRLFGSNQLIVAEVLQSAEVMKRAVAFLEPHMDKKDTASRGTVLLATVKGDVHDIGKNLVDIIFANNGFKVIDLGIKVPPQRLIEAVREHQPDIIGLSGLLVKSAQQMVSTAEDLRAAGITVPILVGGAALSRNFVDRKIAPAYGESTVAYAKDAMEGLDLAKQVVDPARHAELRSGLQARRAELRSQDAKRPAPIAPTGPVSPQIVRRLEALPQPPDLERHVLTEVPLEQLWNYINPVMLYGRHLGVRAPVRLLGTPEEKKLEETVEGRKALAVKARVDAVKEKLRDMGFRPRAVFRFFRAGSEGESLHLFQPDGTPLVRWELPRQQKQGGACIADWVAPLENGRPRDHVALFVTTAGGGIREQAERYKAEGAFLEMHALQAVALETAEAFAELLHIQLRSLWGQPDAPETTMLQRFRAEYAGKRYSFGYPACPDLEQQRELFEALQPSDIGVQLTDGCMMEPEASVSALVLHHPDATYFSVT